MISCNYTEFTLRMDSENMLSVLYAGKPIGSIELYSNDFHNQNQYLRLRLSEYNNLWAAPLFSLLQETVQKPLQVMLSSEDTALAAFLIAGGFERKRSCFEMDVTLENFAAPNSMMPLKTANHGLPEYDLCCRLLFDYYKETHAAINPLTADFEAFCRELPAKAFYQEAGGQIKHFAFVEKNEIAYIGSADIININLFAKTVAAKLFIDYETIYFECDDCDAAAIVLKGLFSTEVRESYDTYVRNNAVLNLAAYCANPCRTASIPYWKAARVQIPQNMRIVHNDDFTIELLKHYTDEPYFRLKHDLLRLKLPKLADRFSICEATLQEYAEHINGCYSAIGISADELQGCTQRSVYAPELWLAIRDSRTGKIVATGIGELDRSIGEGILEWIQVSEKYRGRGLGSFLVLELLNRMKPIAKFVTVSGQCNNPTHPEQLYRKCGFSGTDVWHILRRKSE